MSFSETQEFSRFDIVKALNPYEDAFKTEEARKYGSPSKGESLDPKNAGKLKEGFGSIDKKPDGVSLNGGSNRLSAEIQQQELLDKLEADSMRLSFIDPKVGFPPIKKSDVPGAIGLTDTSSSYAKVNIGGTEGGNTTEALAA